MPLTCRMLGFYKVFVHVQQAKNLKNLDGGTFFAGGLSDPYTVGYVNGDQDSLMKTRIIDNVSVEL